jgi:hypothetical protein
MSYHVKSCKIVFVVYILLFADLGFYLLFSCPPGKKMGRNFPGGFHLDHELFSRKRNSMRCDRCGIEITGHFFELDGYLWEEHAQSDLEMILCDLCYNNEVKITEKDTDFFPIAKEKRC